MEFYGTGLNGQRPSCKIYLFIYFTTYKKNTRKERSKTNTVHIYARLRTKKERQKKTETKKLSDYINNIYKFTRPYERYYSACMNITDINLIILIYKWNEKGNCSALMWYLCSKMSQIKGPWTKPQPPHILTTRGPLASIVSCLTWPNLHLATFRE